jgi:hypothetical protein
MGEEARMVKIAEIDVLHALTAPVSKGAAHPTVSLVEHLRAATSISDYLCKGLADLLDEHGTSALQLRLGRRDKRRASSKEDIDRNFVAYQRVQQLAEAEVTDELCRDILAGLPGWKLKQQRGNICCNEMALPKLRAGHNQLPATFRLKARDDKAPKIVIQTR